MAGFRSRNIDWAWWLISAVVGGVAYWADFQLTEAAPELSKVTFLLLMLVLPGVLGYLRPKRPWRWAVGFLSVIFGRLLIPVLPSVPLYFMHPEWIFPTLAFLLHPNVALATLRLALAVCANFAGAYLGFFLRRRISPTEVTG